jgi:hypothetical protein
VGWDGENIPKECKLRPEGCARVNLGRVFLAAGIARTKAQRQVAGQNNEKISTPIWVKDRELMWIR